MDNGELLGNRYGNLVATEFLGVIDIGGSRRSAYKCICKCGKLKDVSAKNLKDGKVRSCGCIRAAKPKTKDEMKKKSKIYSEKNKIRRAKRAEILAKAGYTGPRAMSNFFNDFSLVVMNAIGVNEFRDLVESALHREENKVLEESVKQEKKELNWGEAKENFDAVMQSYKDLLGTPGVMTGPALMMVFEPISRRYESGERTKELYDEMMSVE